MKKTIIFLLFLTLIFGPSMSAVAVSNDCISRYSSLSGGEDIDRVNRIQKRAETVCELKDDLSWYIDQKNNLNIIWILLTSSTIIFGTLVSIAVGRGLVSDNQYWKWSIAILSMLSTLATGFLQTFNVQGVFELRQSGIIAIERLIFEAKGIQTNNEDEFRKSLRIIEEKKINITESQSNSFFSAVKNKPK